MSKTYPRADLVGSIVGFILISSRNGKFYPKVATVHDSEGDNDAFLAVVGEQGPKASYEEALACFDGEGSKGLAHVFKHPISTSMTGMTWLCELTTAEAKPIQLKHREALA